MSFENRLVKSDIYLFHICMESAVWMRETHHKNIMIGQTIRILNINCIYL